MDSEPVNACTPDGRPSVTFSFFVSLLRELSKIEPCPAGSLTKRNKLKDKDVVVHDYNYPARTTFRNWCERLRREVDPLPPGTTSIIFRFLFPEQDVARKYGLQETMLGRHLSSIFVISTAAGHRGAFLKHWKDEAATGCLGSELRAVLSDVSSESQGRIGQLTIHEVNDFLTELAALNAFSSRSVRSSFHNAPKRTQRAILSDLFLSLPVTDAGFLAQIILKDLRPMLYPIAARDTYTALLGFKSNAVFMLSMEDAMRIIREALGFPPDPKAGDLSKAKYRPKIECNIVLEAEMVAFLDEENRIDEFWRIRSLIESTAHGVRSRRPRQPVHDTTQNSLVSDASDGGTRHLALVFFDIIVLDSESYLYQPYRVRRELLENIINVIPGRAMLSQRFSIPVKNSLDTTEAQCTLRQLLATHIADYEEGLVLKADGSLYRDNRRPWVKVKKDYIPGYGDCLDLAVVGAGWDKERGRELRVAPNTLTTFYLGALSNPAEVDHDPFARPHFEIYFTVSYGPNRSALEDANNTVQRSPHTTYSDAIKRPSLLPYDFTLGHGVAAPQIMLHEPLLAELFGAGFTKADEAKFYELRWPRMPKLYRKAERDWRGGATVRQIQRIAHEVVGRPSAEDDARNCVSGIWGQPVMDVPGLRTPQKRATTIEAWVSKLEAFEKGKEADKDVEDKGDDNSDLPFEGQRARRPTELGHKPLHSMTNLAREPTLIPSSYMHLPTPQPSPPRKRRYSGGENVKVEESSSPQQTSRKTKKRRTTLGLDIPMQTNVSADVASRAHEDFPPRQARSPSPSGLQREPTEIVTVPLVVSSRLPPSRPTHSPPVSRMNRPPEPVPSVVFTPSTPFPQLRSIYFKDVTERRDKPKLVMEEIQPAIEYFKESYVWLGLPPDIEEKPSWMRAISDFIPEEQHFTNLEKMFDACGWGPTGTTPPENIKRGLIIVDRQPRVIAPWRRQNWGDYEEYARKLLEDKKDAPDGLPPGRRLPISLADICILSVHGVEEHHRAWKDRYVYRTVE
ncbi:hypothetical protein OF83DRAFT_1142144 [Amylostereum chailletii]|nr:hypothetical protein OF83DRAFT_1142144 [Amylostereum chailletii]